MAFMIGCSMCRMLEPASVVHANPQVPSNLGVLCFCSLSMDGHADGYRRGLGHCVLVHYNNYYKLIFFALVAVWILHDYFML